MKRVMFNNRHNTMISDESGNFHWISRSVVVVCLVKWRNKFLVVKRGNKVIETGKWCLPCGYLDYDETIEECAIREIWEETGIDIREYDHNLKIDYIVSNPKKMNQDVGFHFLIEFNSEKVPSIDFSFIDPEETTDVKWIEHQEISDLIFAFNHDKKILDHINQLNHEK